MRTALQIWNDLPEPIKQLVLAELDSLWARLNDGYELFNHSTALSNGDGLSLDLAFIFEANDVTDVEDMLKYGPCHKKGGALLHYAQREEFVCGNFSEITKLATKRLLILRNFPEKVHQNWEVLNSEVMLNLAFDQWFANLIDQFVSPKDSDLIKL